MREFVAENVFGFGGREVTTLFTPAHDGIDHSADQLTHRGFALRGIGLAVKILGSDNVRRGHRPNLGDFDVFLAENYLTFIVAYECSAALPFALVEGRNFSIGKAALEFQARGPTRCLICFSHTVHCRPCFSHLFASAQAVLPSYCGRSSVGGSYYFTPKHFRSQIQGSVIEVMCTLRRDEH